MAPASMVGKCDACSNEGRDLYVCNSITGQPCSLAYCVECINGNVEAPWLLSATYAVAEGNLAEWWWDVARRTALQLGYDFWEWVEMTHEDAIEANKEYREKYDPQAEADADYEYMHFSPDIESIFEERSGDGEG